MIGHTPANINGSTNVGTKLDAQTIYIPLQFWFCRNAGLALPLIALQYHEVKINIEFGTLANVAMNYKDGDTSFTTQGVTGCSIIIC